MMMVPRGGVPLLSISNILRWLTFAKSNVDPQKVSGALANLSVLRVDVATGRRLQTLRDHSPQPAD